MKNKFNLLFFASAILMEILLTQFTLLNLNGNIPLFIFVQLECFVLFFLAYYLLKKEVISFKMPGVLTSFLSRITGINEDLSVAAFILLLAVIFRLTLFPTSLTTSPDAYRYIWEGKVIVNGFNPYELEPLNPRLNNLHSDILPSKINFAQKPAIYPPAAQFIFAAAYLISGESFIGLKLIYLLAEILTFIFLLKILHWKNKDINLVILYAWLPLPIMEFFINSHLDVFGITFLVIFIYFFEKGNYYKSAVFFALSFLSKFFPLFLLPLIIKKAGLKRSAVFTWILVLITIIFYLPFISGNANIFSFLMQYIEKWEFNASIYYLVKLVTSGPAAKVICGLLFLASVAVIAVMYKDFVKASAAVLISFTIFASTVYPWYLGWIAALTPVWTFSSVMSLFFTSNLSNLTPMGEIWKEYTPVLLAEYIPFFVFLGWDIKKNLKRSPKVFNKQ